MISIQNYYTHFFSTRKDPNNLSRDFNFFVILEGEQSRVSFGRCFWLEQNQLYRGKAFTQEGSLSAPDLIEDFITTFIARKYC